MFGNPRWQHGFLYLQRSELRMLPGRSAPFLLDHGQACRLGAACDRRGRACIDRGKEPARFERDDSCRLAEFPPDLLVKSLLALSERGRELAQAPDLGDDALGYEVARVITPSTTCVDETSERDPTSPATGWYSNR